MGVSDDLIDDGQQDSDREDINDGQSLTHSDYGPEEVVSLSSTNGHTDSVQEVVVTKEDTVREHQGTEDRGDVDSDRPFEGGVKMDVHEEFVSKEVFSTSERDDTVGGFSFTGVSWSGTVWIHGVEVDVCQRHRDGRCGALEVFEWVGHQGEDEGHCVFSSVSVGHTD